MKNIFRTRFAAHSLGWLLLQQLIVASSSYWLMKLAAAITTGEGFGLYFGLFLASLTLVYVPNVFAMVGLEKWKQELFKWAIDSFYQNHEHRIDLLSNAAARESRHSFVTRESFAVIEGSTGYFYQLTATALNVVLNVGVISATFDWRLAIAYAVSSVFATLIILKAMPAIERKSGEVQQSRVSLTDLLMKSWGTLLIGNAHNMNVLRTRTEQRREKSVSTAVGAKSYNEWLSLATTYGATLPVFVCLIYLMLVHRTDAAFLLALVATLHRQILIIQCISALVTSGVEFGSVRALWQGLESSLGAPDAQDLAGRIRGDLIEVRGEDPVRLDELASKRVGRYVLKGPNGAGKSTWLMKQKAEAGERAYYLPANVDLQFEALIDELSSGQRVASALGEIYERTGHEMYLLDEWDANLDAVAIQKLERTIDELAKRSCVIEVRHRA